MDLNQLQSYFPQLKFEENKPLAPLTYMKIGGVARLFVKVSKLDDLYCLCAFCFAHTIPFVILGGASNVLIADEGISKLVILNRCDLITISPKTDEHVYLKAESGVITAVLANRAISENLGGLEYFVGVPGTVGGAIVNNSHFSAKELIGDLVSEVEVCTLAGEREIWKSDKLKFDYDYSVFHERGDVILSATFLLHSADPVVLHDNLKAVAQKRVDTQPIGIPSSGCMWRNPKITASQFEKIQSIVIVPESAYHPCDDGKIQIAAGFLIDRAGLKGKSEGGVAVSEKHATYLVNTGNGTSKDVEILCQKVESALFGKFGVKLEREVFFI